MKKLCLILASIFLLFPLAAKSGNSTQIIQSGHWVYDDLYVICMETRQAQFLSNQPLSVGELKFYFSQVDYESLSFSSRILYDKVNAFLNKSDDFFSEQELRFFVNAKLTPEFYYKSNEDIDWSFSYNYRDFALTVPIIFGFSDYVTIEPDLFLGKSYIASQDPHNFTNIAYAGDQFEFLTPRFAYGSTGATFNNWGVNLHVGKEGLKIGQTHLGSIIYNDTFETDCYVQLNLFTKWLKYTMDVAQVDNSKFFYVHQLDIRVFRNLKFGMIEGSLLNSSFELRYLNPFMIMHQFGSWRDYGAKLSDAEEALYGEGHFCAYLGFTLEYMPVRNVRIYGLFAQNEILDLGGSRTDYALSVPDSLGGQLGVDVTVPLEGGHLVPYAEVSYTSPYLYIKQSPDWSLYRARRDMQSGEYVSTWMGSPFGPDCFAVQTGIGYRQTGGRLELGGSYLFKAHGENDFSLFTQTGTYQGEDVYTYYPSVEYGMAETDEQRLAARDKGRYMWMTGIPEFTNTLSVYASYYIIENLSLHAKFSYSLVFNSAHEENAFVHGAEIVLAAEYRLLK